MSMNTPSTTRCRLRRNLYATFLAAGLSVILAACGSTSSTGASSPGSAAASGAQSSSSGGTLTVSLPAPPQSLNPGLDGNGGQNIVQWLAYEPLIRTNADGTFSPGLATSWKYVGVGNLQFDLEIRTGAKFADGTPVTADSVVKTIQYYLKHPAALSHYLTGVSGATASGSTVTVKLTTPNPILPLVFSQSANWGDVISPAGLATPDQLTQKTFGAGPYVLDPAATIAGDHYTFTKNANYWNPSAQHYSKVIVKVIADSNAALQALSSGQTQVVIGGAPTLADQAKSTGLQAVQGNVGVIGMFLMDRAGVTSPALGKVEVRQAMNYAIDRAGLAKALGSAFTPSSQIVSKGGDGYDAALDALYPYDPAKAKQLLATAGYPDGFSMKLVDVSLNSADTISQAMVAQLGAVGIKVTLTSDGVDLTKFITDMASKTYGASTFGTGGPMFANALQNFAVPTSPLNPFNSQNAQIMAAFKALGSASQADAPAAAVALNKAVSEQAWFVPAVSTSNWTFAKGINNLGPMGTTGELDFLKWS